MAARYVLGVETSAGAGSLALLRNGVLVSERALEGRRGAGLVPAAQSLLAGAKLAPADLSLVAVDVGPGSFTGVRLGVAFAKTLAYVTGCGLAAVSSLEARALEAARKGARSVLAVSLDARRGRVYGAAFQVLEEGNGLKRLLEDALFDPERLRQAVPSGATWLGEEAPSAATVALLGEASPRIGVFALAPAYLRMVEAQEHMEKKRRSS